jgi:hypothetical protein
VIDTLIANLPSPAFFLIARRATTFPFNVVGGVSTYRECAVPAQRMLG